MGKSCTLYTAKYGIYTQLGKPKYIWKILETFKKDIDNNTLIIRDFNTPLLIMDRSSKQKINRDTVALMTLGQKDLIDINRTSQRTKIYILFKYTYIILIDKQHGKTQNKPQHSQEN